MSDDGERHPTTPDGRYFVVRGRLWRCSDPSLVPARRQELVVELTSARRALRNEGDHITSRKRIDDAKRGLGERGPVWWTDGAPDYNRRLVKNTQIRIVVRRDRTSRDRVYRNLSDAFAMRMLGDFV